MRTFTRILLLLIWPMLSLFWFNLSHALMPLPTGREVYSYRSTESPTVNVDPSQARPVGVGPVAEGDDPLRLRISLDAFAGPVNIYLAVFFPTVDPYNIYLLKPDGSFQRASDGLVPWKSSTTELIDEPLFGDLPSAILPPATYNVWLLASPSQNLDVFYLWMTKFFVGGWTFEEVENRIVADLGEDPGFDAIMFAFEKGYSLAQVTEAAVTKRLQSSGDIMSALGGPETPDETPSTLFIKSIQKEKMDTAPTYDINELRGLVKKTATQHSVSLFKLIFGLFQNGYSPRQVTEGIILNHIGFETSTDTYVPVIVDENENVVVPESVAKGVIQTAWLIVTVKGPNVLYLMDGKAKGEWTVTVVGGKPPYYLTAYYSDTDEYSRTFKASNRSWTFSHAYTKAGQYYFRGIANYGEENSQAYRSIRYEVEVKEKLELSLPYTYCIIRVDLDKAKVKYASQSGEEIWEGNFFFQFDANGVFEPLVVSGNRFTGSAEAPGSGTMTIDIKETYLGIVADSFEADFTYAYGESGDGGRRAIEGGGVVLTQGESAGKKYIVGYAYDEDMCKAIRADGLYYKQTYYGVTTEYLSHSCAGYLKVYCYTD